MFSAVRGQTNIFLSHCFQFRISSLSLKRSYFVHNHSLVLMRTRNQDLWSCSRIWDMALWDEMNIALKCQSVRLLLCFWPLTASITLEVRNIHAHVKTAGILNKFTKNKKICGIYGSAVMMVESTSTPIKNIDKTPQSHWEIAFL